MKNIALILASGTGERAGLNIPKQFALIRNKTILEYSIEVFSNNENIDYIIVVSNPNFLNETTAIVERNNYKKVLKVIPGGKTRQESSYIGVNSINESDAKVLIHDAVRPFISDKIINECIYALDKYKAVNVAIDSSDTIIEIDDNNIIKKVPNRKYLRRCQTPQCFDLQLIKKAHELAKINNISVTDDCGLVIKFNLTDVFVVNGSTDNIKITYPDDIKIAEVILDKKKREN